MKFTNLTQDSRKIAPGSAFFCIEGSSQDGHEFARAALEKGADAVFMRKDHPRTLELQAEARFKTKIIAVSDTRIAMGEVASEFYQYPSRHLWVCGITGTNGKTTSTYLLETLLEAAGKHTAVVGTIENRIGDYKIPSTHTTPDAITLQSLLNEFRQKGADAVAIEVTSHALDQKRTAGTYFKAALFTNLTQDHLDYHKTLENYFQTKAKLFLDYSSASGEMVRAIHADDLYGKRLVSLCRSQNLEVMTFGKTQCNVNYEGLDISAEGIKGDLRIDWKKNHSTIPIYSPLLGTFNAQNLAGVVTVALGLNLPVEKIMNALSKAQVPGRLERIPNDRGVTVVVDYAHTPDALENALKTLRSICKKRLVCVFGCGGNRDSGKRPIMGAIAERLSDLVFVTSDNPRTEDPDTIICQILNGLKRPTQAKRLGNRREAIAQAIASLQPGDVLLIAGKGHEDYQIVGTQKLPFDDRRVALEHLRL